jgi:putative membrane protein
LLGAIMLALGIWYHVNFMWGLRIERKRMTANGLFHGESGYPVSLTLIIACLLFLAGLLAAVSMIFDVGPFG